MADSHLTAARLRKLLEYDPTTGVFRWKVYRNFRAKPGDVAGHASDYVRISVDAVDHLAHRLAWLYVTGTWPSNLIDHRDGNPFNNIWDNLREITNSGNLQNQGRTSLGVSWSKSRQKFVAQIKYDGKNRMIGRFDTFEAAKSAYLEAKRSHHFWSVRDV